MTLRSALILLVCGVIVPAHATELTPAQSKLIALLTYVQVARDHCGYLIDVDLLRSVAAREGITFTAPDQQRARDDGFADAERAFSTGLRAIVECGYALERFGPNGSEFPALIDRRPSPKPD